MRTERNFKKSRISFELQYENDNIQIFYYIIHNTIALIIKM